MSDAQEMPEATLRALRASIEHWVENGKAETPNDADSSASACSLCHLFWLEGCLGCPVSSATAQPCCIGTPHPLAADALGIWRKVPSDTARAVFHEFAHDMENFLRALVPAGASS